MTDPALRPFSNQRSKRVRLVHVQSPYEVEQTRELFREYERSLDTDLCFQDFEREVAELPGEYSPPAGRLLLCYDGEALAGCVALRRIDQTTCEMKRLFIRPTFRGKHLGRDLVLAIISEARVIGYQRMKLDTLPTMKKAIDLYRALGFKAVAAYRHNPVPGALFMELELSRK
jgi:putative acetyltransferase